MTPPPTRRAEDVARAVAEPQQAVLSGVLDHSTACFVRLDLHRAVDACAGRLVLDVTAASVPDVAGLGLLVGLQRRAERLGGRLELRGASPALSTALARLDLDRVLSSLPVQRLQATG